MLDVLDVLDVLDALDDGAQLITRALIGGGWLEQKAAERRVEMERMNRHYEQMTSKQEERINKEERDRFLARQRA